jgi:phospholipid/cholesterol/gamma-HCH transport system substrate-binding protein
MKRSIIETLLGAVVILTAAWFLVYSYKTGGKADSGGGYEVHADFSGVGGLKNGDDVTISGVKVGSVSSVSLVPETYLARVKINLENSIKLPTDTAATISSHSLLGGRYLSLEPGADEGIIPDGGKIEYTQAPQNLEQLLGQFIFSMQKGDKKEDDAEGESHETSTESTGDETIDPQSATDPAPAIVPSEGAVPDVAPNAVPDVGAAPTVPDAAPVITP